MKRAPGVELARRLPDEPGWVDARALLLSGDFVVHGDIPAGAVVAATHRSVCVTVGAPARVHVEAALADGRIREVVTSPGLVDVVAGIVPDWTCRHAPVLTLPDDALAWTMRVDADVRLVDANTPLGHAPEPIQKEMTEAIARTELASAFVDGRPATFCYSVFETEAWWEVSIDTLAEHRRRGLAVQTTAWMIQRIRERGKAPIYAAVTDNVSSHAVARKLGFQEVDRWVLFWKPKKQAGDERLW